MAKPDSCPTRLDLEAELDLTDPDPPNGGDESDDSSDDSSLTSAPSIPSPLPEEPDPNDLQARVLAAAEALASPDVSFEESNPNFNPAIHHGAALRNLALGVI
ncbi:hypothetical protein NDA10_004646 [Ustilago hordei]|nr:hypothetical protein NDA10_004646 [Ustilago hordei]